MADETLDKALSEAMTAARDLARASAKLTKRLLQKADKAARDPKGTVSRAARSAAKELESASREIDELLKKL